MKLYRVHIDRVLYVMADDALDAEHKALDAETNMDETEVDVERATPRMLQADGWENHPPYGQRLDGTPFKTAIQLICDGSP